MESNRKKNLIRHKSLIARDLKVDDVLDELYSKSVVTKTEYDSLRKAAPDDSYGAAKRLVEIIGTKENNCYVKFVESLRSEYGWLSEALNNELQVINTDDGEDDLDGLQEILPIVPKFPPHYVKRTSRLEDLRKEISYLKPNGTIVLHGMTLIGKSCLVNAAVLDKKVLNACDNKIFWISLGEIHDLEADKDKIIIEMYSLLTSEDESIDGILTDNIEDTMKIKALRSKLRNMFARKRLMNSLLILDKVRISRVVELFDFGCKMVVTTSDLNFVDRNNNTKVIKMNDGFTQQETIKLFEKCLNSKLSDTSTTYATAIHRLCKGYPMSIALIGSLFEDSPEEALNNDLFWANIFEKLQNDDLNSDIDRKLPNALTLCIEKLPDGLRKYYEDLAIFADDVNITPKVLEILWGETDFTVRRIMVQLEKKSLILSIYKTELKTYVYGIHHLLLSRLRKSVPDLKLLHQKLINAHGDVCRERSGHLPVDNYMLEYYGYHLEKAEMLDKFNVYFDFNFIEAKIRYVGCADLLRDLQIYRKYITRNEPSLELKLQEYEKFVNEYGYTLYKYPYTTIVQCGLQQPVDGSVYNAAFAIANKTPKKLYLQLQLSQERHYFTHILELQYNITAACFTNDTNEVLIGTDTGKIIMWEQHYKREICTFVGHERKILCLHASPDRKDFLSVSEDGTVKLWTLPSGHSRHSFGSNMSDYGDDSIPSPFLKQKNYHNFFGEEENIACTATFTSQNSNENLISAAFSHNYATTRLIITGSCRGEVVVWNTETERAERKIPLRGFPAKCVAFSADDCTAIFSANKNIVMYNIRTGDYLLQFTNHYEVNLIFVIPTVKDFEHRLIAISGPCLSSWKWKTDIDSATWLEHVEIKDNDYSKATFTCGAVTKDGNYLVTGTTDLYLRTYDLNLENAQNVVVEKYNEGKVVCLDTFFKDNEDSQVHILLVGSENKTVKQWVVHSDVKETTVKNLPVFATFWLRPTTKPRIAILNTEKKIQVLNGYKLLMETSALENPVTTICFSACGDKIACGLENGDIYEFDYKSRTETHVMSLNGSVNLLKYFRNGDQDSVQTEPVSSFLVAASENGHFMCYKSGKQISFRRNGVHSTIKPMAITPIVRCYFVKRVQKLLTVAHNRTVTVWDWDGTNAVLIGDRSNCTVVDCTIAPNEKRLLCTLSDDTFEAYNLKCASNVELELLQNKKLDGKLSCCCFSYDGNVLAFGKEDGGILIWGFEKKTILCSLNLHQSPVRFMRFSPEPAFILVSLGEQIAWWDLSKLVATVAPIRVDKLRSLKNLSLTNPFVTICWSDKQGHNGNEHLLSAIKLLGSHAKEVSASDSFTCFVTVDNNGKIYIMDVLENYS